MTRAHDSFTNLLEALFTTHIVNDRSGMQIACALMQGSHLVVNIGKEALQLPCVLSLPSPWLLLVGPLLGMLDAGEHIDLHMHHLCSRITRAMMAIITSKQ
jgi:hypothetical protein